MTKEIADDAVELGAEERQLGAVFARFYGIDDDGEVVTLETVKIADFGGPAAVASRCAAAGEEADLVDAVGFTLGRVINDGSLDRVE